MDASLETLCWSCGLCCDGTLFGRVSLERAEVEPARKNRLRVIPSGTSMEQPCSALSGDAERRDCSVYGERPSACRTFECRLFVRHRLEGGPLEPRLASIRRVRALIRDLDASDSQPADMLAELTTLLDDDFARA